MNDVNPTCPVLDSKKMNEKWTDRFLFNSYNDDDNADDDDANDDGGYVDTCLT